MTHQLTNVLRKTAMVLILAATFVPGTLLATDTRADKWKLVSSSEDGSPVEVASRAKGPEEGTPAFSYRVDSGDHISVTVYQEPDLSVRDVRVKADGTIAFPLLGDLQVAGLTSQELQALVTRELLNGYLKKPNVTVSIDSYRLYYIKGEVTRPGGYAFIDGLTVAKAVALAGGFTARASENKISLVREPNPEEPIEPAGLNTPILPGDIVTVGESFF